MRTVKCPNCGKPAPFEPSNLFRPFCSERCQTLDLGAWASENFRIPSEEAPEGVNQKSDQHAAEDQEQDLNSRRH